MKNPLKPQAFTIAIVALLLGSTTTMAQDDQGDDISQAGTDPLSVCLDPRGIPTGSGPTTLLLLGQMPDGSNVYEPTEPEEAAPDCGLGSVFQCGDESADAYILYEDLDVLCAQQSTAAQVDPCDINIHFEFTQSAAACQPAPRPEPCEILEADLPGPCGGSVEVCDTFSVPEVCYDYKPAGLCDIYGGAPGTCGNPPPPTDYCSYYNQAPGTCGNPPPPTDPCDPRFINSGLCDFDICDVKVDIPLTCGNPPPPTSLCDYYNQAPGTCGNPPPPTSLCDYYNQAPGTCGNPPPPTSLCDYYNQAPGTCGNPPPPTGLCDYYGEVPGTCDNPPPPTGLCDYYNAAPGTCGNPGPELCPEGSCNVEPPCSTYKGSDGTTWCATPSERAQDAIPDGPVPLVFEKDNDDAEAILFEQAVQFAVQMEEPGFETSIPGLPDRPLIPDVGVEYEVHLDVKPLNDLDQQSSSASTQAASSSCSMSTCTVVFIRGYDGGDTTGYGGYTAMHDYFLANGYNEVLMVDTYGRCVGNVNLMGYGGPGKTPHETWFAGHHAGANSCSPSGHHDTNTDMRHMAYHLAWWLYQTYGSQPVDVVAHSMGGLLIRYALTMVEAKNPNWPPYLNVEDAVTFGTPHKGTNWGCFANNVQGDNMCPSGKTMKWMKTHAQNPQGMAGTDWTLIAADEDSTVSEQSGVGMVATTKLWYNKNCCNYEEDTNYGHNDYYKDPSEEMDGSYYWQKAGGDWKKSSKGPHSIKRAWYGTIGSGQ